MKPVRIAGSLTFLSVVLLLFCAATGGPPVSTIDTPERPVPVTPRHNQVLHVGSEDARRTVRLSWKAADEGNKPASYELRLKCLTSPGICFTEQTAADSHLAPGLRAGIWIWALRARSRTGTWGPWSRSAMFEIQALLDAEAAPQEKAATNAPPTVTGHH
jgi:hypothetical protein